jgi:hypothetical protein
VNAKGEKVNGKGEKTRARLEGREGLRTALPSNRRHTKGWMRGQILLPFNFSSFRPPLFAV